LASVFFRGNAPTAGTTVFSTGTIYYSQGTTTWGINYAGRPTALLVEPAITTQPVNVVVNQGATATFTVTATGTVPVYQWQKDGVDIVGATAATLSLSNVQSGNAGSYTVFVSNAQTVTSSAATLTVIVPPVITVQPVSVTANLGASASFSVTTTGTSSTYQWKKAGVDIAGATTATLSLSNVQAVDAASYTVTATNAAGTVTSNAVTLTVIITPVITTSPVSITVNQAANASFSVTATGTTPTYQWQKDGVDLTGATAATLSLSNVQSSNAGSYTVTVSNAAGTMTSSAATLTVIVLPVITTQPVSVTANLGASASFSVTTTGTSPTYQWKKAGVNIEGATTATLSFGALLATDAGSYTVTATNAAGTVTSSTVTLTVISPPTISTPPATTRVNQVASASFSVVAAGGAPYTYQWQKDGADMVGATASTLNLSNVQTSDAASYAVTITNAAGSVTSSAAVLTVTVPILITAQPVSVTANLGTGASFSVTATGTTPTYQWKKAGVNITGATTATLSFGSLLATDAGSYTVVVTNAAGSVTSSATTLTVISPPTISVPPASTSKNLGTSTSFSVTATGGAPYTYQWKKDGSDIVGATAATLSFATLSSTDAGSYTVVVSNAAGTVTSNAAILTVVVVPTIAAQPVSINANQGASATFSVTAAGGGTYTYQWKKAGVNITGATAATLTLSNVQPVDAVAYSVTVTNAMGTVTSNAANLTVIVPPVIIDQPTHIIANPGEGAVFSVVTTGSAPTYQWKRNGVIVAGATQADLNFTTIQPLHVGSYKVVVSNAAGSVTSATVSLTLNTVFTQSQYDVIADAARAEILDSPNAHGLYNLSQVQALNVGTPLLARDAASGKFKLTVKAKKSTDLVNFSDLPFSAGDAVINGNGEMEFQFASPDNAAFFRIESR
jgi:hypothetical protein